MGFKPGEENQSSNIRKAIEEAGLDMGTVWIAYFTMGGNAGTWEVEAYIGGALSLPALERDVLAQAINELIDELPPRRKATFNDEAAGMTPGTVDKTGRVLMPPSPVPGNAGSGDTGGKSREHEDHDGGRRQSAGSGGHSDDEAKGGTRQSRDGQGRDQ